MLTQCSCSKCTAAMLLRITLGLSLFFVGVGHYMQFQSFRLNVSDGLAYLSVLGDIWAFVLPALLIVGGGLLVAGRFREIASWCVGLGLGSIAAGAMLKPLLSGIGVGEVMPDATQAFIWLAVFALVCKGGCCAANDAKSTGMKK